MNKPAVLLLALVMFLLSLVFVSCRSAHFQANQEVSCVEGTMSLVDDEVISAQVLLRSASGKEIGGETIITSDNISEYTPSSETVAQVTDALVELGFEVGEMVGISMSITAPASTFAKIFNVRLCQGKAGGIQVVGDEGSLDDEIPPSHWPESLASFVVAITFVPPPDFGPTEFFGP